MEITTASFLTLLAIRVQDIEAQQWYNWDVGSWDAGGAPQCGFGKPIYVAGYARNDGDAGDCTISLLFGTQTLATQTLTLATGGTIQFEWTGLMPATDMALSIVLSQGPPPVLPVYYDFTVTGYGEQPPLPFLTLTTIRVQDVESGVWYNWDNGAWDVEPTCGRGRNLYVAGMARNDGGSGECIIQLVSGTILKQTVGLLNNGETIGFEWTGMMSQANFALSIIVNTNLYTNFTVTAYGEAFLTLVAIRQQDLDAQKWYNWDVGVWDATPKCGFGRPIYIAGYARNDGYLGECTIELRNGQNVLATQTLTLNSGETIQIEWTGTMLTTDMGFSVVVNTNLYTNFTVTGYESGFQPIPLWIIALAGGLGVVTVVAVNSDRFKKKRRKKKR